MRYEKSLWPPFAPRNRKRMTAFLENQALKGWLFDGFGGLGWKFRRIEPQKLRFSVVYFSVSANDDLEERLKIEEFREFCAHDGWQFAGGSNVMQIFYSEKENPTPIETDPLLEVENIVKAQGHGLGESLMAVGLVLGLMAVYMWLENQRSVILLLTHQWGVWVILLCATCLLENLIFTIKFKFWEKKARRQALEYGEFLDESPMMALTNWVAYGWLVLIVAALIYTAGWRVFLWRMGTWGLMFAALLIIGGWIRNKKYEKSKRNMRLFLAYFLIFSFGIDISNLISEKLDVGFDLNAPEGSAWVQYAEIPPLTGENLGITAEETPYTVDLRETGFLARYRVEGTEFTYTVVDVKTGFLYDLCLKAITPERSFPVDAAPWGTEQAYQFGVNESPSDPWWILCYEDRIVEIRLPEEPTPDQMALIGENLSGKE